MKKRALLKDQLLDFIKKNYSEMPFANENVINDFLKKYPDYAYESVGMCLAQLTYKKELKRLQRGIYIYNSNDKKD